VGVRGGAIGGCLVDDHGGVAGTAASTDTIAAIRLAFADVLLAGEEFDLARRMLPLVSGRVFSGIIRLFIYKERWTHKDG